MVTALNINNMIPYQTYKAQYQSNSYSLTRNDGAIATIKNLEPDILKYSFKYYEGWSLFFYEGRLLN